MYYPWNTYGGGEGLHTIVQKSTCCLRVCNTNVEIELPLLDSVSLILPGLNLHEDCLCLLYIMMAKPKTLLRS